MTEELEKVNKNDAEQPVSRLQVLKQKADIMGVEYYNSITADKLQERIELREKEIEEKTNKADNVTPYSNYETSKVGRVKEEAFKLVRFKLVVNDINKQSWSGMAITAGNDVVGHVERVIPFNADVWHAEAIIVEHMKNMRFPLFPTKQTTKMEGTFADHSKPRMMPTFTIIELPPLTETELKELAEMQASQGTGQSQDE